MPKNEDGEFELILGNRQLLSVFFIVVILLGVFFTMGYIVGRNSTPSVLEAASSRNTATPVVESTARPSETPKPPVEPAPVETAPQKPAATEKETAVKTETPKPAAPKSEAAGTESKKDKAAKARTPAVNSEPVTGQTYLQLAATTRHEADIMVDVLRNKGFKAIASEIEEKPGTFRVLVGPLAEGGANKMRADLQDSGFPGNSAIRRVF